MIIVINYKDAIQSSVLQPCKGVMLVAKYKKECQAPQE